MPSKRPVGLFDSGVGGLTVAQEVVKQLPRESFIYFGDTLHVPYGGRSRQELVSFADAISAFLIDQGAKLIIDACNSTSSVALDYLREKYTVPFIGLVEPGVRAALSSTRNGRIGLIATEATVNSEAHLRLVQSFDPGIELVARACPFLVPLVESGGANSPEALMVLGEYLSPLQEQGIDTLILGCTHYPFLSPAIRQIVGPDVVLIDPAQEAVREVASVLASSDLKAPELSLVQHRYYVSGDPDSFRRNAEQLTGWQLSPVKRVNLEPASCPKVEERADLKLDCQF